jgi:hypothetical protein
MGAGHSLENQQLVWGTCVFRIFGFHWNNQPGVGGEDPGRWTIWIEGSRRQEGCGPGDPGAGRVKRFERNRENRTYGLPVKVMNMREGMNINRWRLSLWEYISLIASLSCITYSFKDTPLPHPFLLRFHCINGISLLVLITDHALQRLYMYATHLASKMNKNQV